MVVVVEPSLEAIKVWGFKSGREVVSFSLCPDRIEKAGLARVLSRRLGVRSPEAIAFHIFFGADHFRAPQKLSERFFGEFRKLSKLFPFYIPATQDILFQFYKSFKGIPLVAFFETSFFSALPAPERYYAIPQAYHRLDRVKKFGFHGLLHEASAGVLSAHRKVVSVVLDRQTTVCAIDGGRARTISLGYTPLEGIMSRSACGDLDPGIVFYLMNRFGYSLFKIDEMLKKESGFVGLTGYDIPMEDFAGLYGKDARVNLAFDVYESQILKYIGEGIAALGGIDAIVFSGVYVPVFSRSVYRIVREISFLGVNASPLPWEIKPGLTRISTSGSPVSVFFNGDSVAAIIARRTVRLTGKRARSSRASAR